MLVKSTIQELQQKLKDEHEQRTVCQKEAQQCEHLTKVIEEENEAIRERLTEVELEKSVLKRENEEAKHIQSKYVDLKEDYEE